MARLFPMADLRNLVARALLAGSYQPGESKRVRAVPDTRTIRYYTTLGLIDRPTEMVGRTAMYSEIHVLQLVAIKRLQAEQQTLSAIQAALFGATPKQLKTIARLPTDFWEQADRYLAQTRTAAPAPVPATPAEPEIKYWSEPAALPGSRPVPPVADDATSSLKLTPCLRFSPHPSVQVVLEGVALTERSAGLVDLTRLQAAAEPLLSELARQGLLNTDSPSRTA